ncbi:MAG: adventurous gliding motility lipoprotein CglC [Deltaproteobacteria bacterium]|nr:adventurous gliding motility lipoprotein CglC [Deltaproteobacteria bacterium]
MIRASTLVGLAALALTACSATTDLGQTCKMTKPCKEAGCTKPVNILQSEVEKNTGLDYVALGSAECDDLVCIRTANSLNPDPVCPNEGDTTCPASERVAMGYCTSGCLDEANCRPDFQGKSDTMQCNQLLLSDSYLNQLKTEDPDTYNRVFGSGASANYCILPRTAAEQ